MLKYIRSLQTLAAGAWLGGMILIAIVAATTFRVMRETDVASPNTIAGRVMAKNFQRFDLVQGACAVVLVIGQGVIIASNQRHAREWFHAVLIAAAGGLLIYSVVEITPKILEMQDAVGRPDPEAAVRVIFDSIHATSVKIAKVNLLVVAILTISLGATRFPEERQSATPTTPPRDTEAVG